MSNNTDINQQESKYFDLHVSGMGYLNRAREASFKNQDTLQKAWSEAQQLNQSTNFSERYQNVSSAVQAESARISSEHNDSFAGELSNGLTKQSQFREDTQSSYRDVNQWQHTQSRVNDQSFSFQGDVGMAVRRFMIEEEKHSPADVDNIIHRHNMGDTNATATLSDSVSNFSQAHGKELAGIQTTPDTSTMSDARHTNEASINNERSKVEQFNHSHSSSVQQRSQETGLLNASTVQDNVETLQEKSEISMDVAATTVNQGQKSTTSESQKLEQTIENKQQTYSAGAAPGIHETMDRVKTKLTNKFTELLD